MMSSEDVYHSQHLQDKFLNETVFKNKRRGFFVDIGAHDGKTFSNTYFFEKSLNWSGICIEPMPKVFQKLKKSRHCRCIKGCIANFNGPAKFLQVNCERVDTEMLSGLLKNYDPLHIARIKKEIKERGGSTKTIDVQCYRLADILKSHNISYIDYLSIDTEGSEYEILKSIDFNIIDIYIIQVEDNYKDPKIRMLLEQNGYSFLEHIKRDDIYIKNICKKNRFNRAPKKTSPLK
jgi:FkbM family methyltransferase